MFRSERSRQRARDRGKALARQWIEGVRNQHVRIVKLSVHQHEVLELIERARAIMPHWGFDDRAKWMRSLTAALR